MAPAMRPLAAPPPSTARHVRGERFATLCETNVASHKCATRTVSQVRDLGDVRDTTNRDSEENMRDGCDYARWAAAADEVVEAVGRPPSHMHHTAPAPVQCMSSHYTPTVRVLVLHF